MRALEFLLAVLLIIPTAAQDAVATSKPRLLFGSDDWIYRARWSPDSHDIAFATESDSESHVYVVNVISGQSRDLPQVEGRSLDVMRWSQDGESLWLVDQVDEGGGLTYRLHLTTGAVENFSEQYGWNSPAVVSPDERYAAVIQPSEDFTSVTLDMWDIQAGRLVWRLDQFDTFDSAFWTPNGKYLLFEAGKIGNAAISSTYGGFYRVAVDSGEMQYLTDMVMFDYLPPVVSPDGTMVAYMWWNLHDDSAGAEMRVVEVVTRDRRTLGPFDSDYEISWSYDSRYLAYGFGAFEVIEASSGHRCNLSDNVVIPKPMYATFEQPLWSPTDHRLLVRLYEIYLLDPAALSSRNLLPRDAGIPYEMAWSPDGRRVAYLATRDRNSELFVIDVPPSSGDTSALDRCLVLG